MGKMKAKSKISKTAKHRFQIITPPTHTKTASAMLAASANAQNPSECVLVLVFPSVAFGSVWR